MDKFLLMVSENQPMEVRILIVDDNVDLTGILSMILKAEGFTVTVCASLSLAEANLSEWHPDLLLLDVNVNGEDGRDLCKKIKSSPELEQTKIILMSGDETTFDHINSIGANDYLTKPFDSALLIEKINGCLHQATENT